MEYLIRIVLLLSLALIIAFAFRRQKRKAEKTRMDEYLTRGFPRFSDQEQFEMIYRSNFSLLHDRLQVSSLSTELLDQIITISKEDLKNYILASKNIMTDKHVHLNQLDGFWVEKEADAFLYHYRERGKIQSTKRFASKEELIEQFVNDAFTIVPKFSKHNEGITILNE